MISPTRSRDLVSGGLPALPAALEGAQEAGPEVIVHPHELGARIGLLFIAGFRHSATRYRAILPAVMRRPRPYRQWSGHRGRGRLRDAVGALSGQRDGRARALGVAGQHADETPAYDFTVQGEIRHWRAPTFKVEGHPLPELSAPA
jgi:hypothetical protein